MSLDAALRRVERLIDAATPTDQEREDAAYDRLKTGGSEWADWEVLYRPEVPWMRRLVFSSLPLVAALTARGERIQRLADERTAQMLAVAAHPPSTPLPDYLRQFQQDVELKWRTGRDYETRSRWACVRIVLGTDGGDRLRGWHWRRELGDWRIRQSVIRESANRAAPWAETRELLPPTARRALEQCVVGTKKVPTRWVLSAKLGGPPPDFGIRDAPIYGGPCCRTHLDAAVLLDLPRRCPWLSPRDYQAALGGEVPASGGYDAFQLAYRQMLLRRRS